MEFLEKRSCIFILDVLIYLGIMNAHAPIAQLDRVTGYEPVGRGFESLSAYQLTGYLGWDNLLIFYVRKGPESIQILSMYTPTNSQ